MGMHVDLDSSRAPRASDRDLTRRAAVGRLLQCSLLAHPAGLRVFAIGRRESAQDPQPFVAGVRRLFDAMEYLGEPFSESDRATLEAAANRSDTSALLEEIERVVDPRVLLRVRINPEARVSVERGPAPGRLIEQGWRAYLVRVQNEAGVTGSLTIESPQSRPVYRRSTGLSLVPRSVLDSDIADRWLALDEYADRPLEPTLSGLDLEYRIGLLYSRDRGRREAQFGAVLEAATQDLGYRNRTAVLFDIAASHDVTFGVRDENGDGCMASFVVKDRFDRVYPARSKRLAPDFFFHDQVYRADGETLRLPAGEYTVTCGRGPEYLPQTRAVTIDGNGRTSDLDFTLERWIDPPSMGWYSGDHHIHAAGCSHYESPTEGVEPGDMMRHVLGEALSVGAVLNWGPGYYNQRQYFEGKENALSTDSNVIRYDLEISGFPSSYCGHLVLLRVTDQDYPDARQIEDWPRWDLPILQWAKAQGAVTGFAHSGFGLQVQSNELPNYEMPNFDGIGANEYIMDVTHGVVDFISTADTPYPSELNIWYHTLNCGYRTRVSGETDFPCISDDRVGAGRSYVQLGGALTYDEWCEGVRVGRCYVSDGFGHLMDFEVDGLALGTNDSELRLGGPGTVRATARVACLLPEPPADWSRPDPMRFPFWTPEHARVPGTRDVAVEVIVNGLPVASEAVRADGELRDVVFDVPIDQSSWVALRLLGSAHTNPIFVLVGDRPIRGSRRSADWCLRAVDQCWSQKSQRIGGVVRERAHLAYEHARESYRRILSESEVDGL